MEEDIDLRPYVRALGRRWWWVIGLGLLAGAAAFAISYLQPATYQASSLVIVSQPRYQLEFDPRFTTNQQATPPYNAYLKLATSDGVLQALLASYESLPEAEGSQVDLATLSAMTTAASGGDPSLLELRVRGESPKLAASVANLWADLLIKNGNAFYSDPSHDLAFLSSQAAQAQKTLDDTNKALAEFQGRNEIGMLRAQLATQQWALGDSLSTQITVTNIIKDIRGLRGQLEKGPASEPVRTADSLSALLLQIKSLNAGASLPIQVQFSGGESPSGMSRQEQMAYLDNLTGTLQDRQSKGEAELAAFEPKILALQRQLQEAQTELDNLERGHKLAEDTYVTLATKRNEAQIAAQDGNETLQVGSYAAVPQRSISPRPLRNGAVAGVAGLMLGVLVVFAVEWWRK